MTHRFRPAFILCGVAFASLAQAGEVEIKSATASSTYPPEDGASYDAKFVFDKKAATSWVEGDDGSGKGAYIELDLGSSKDVAEIELWGGMWYSVDFWNRGNRPKEFAVKFDDGSTETLSITDKMESSSLKLSSPKKTQKIRLTLKDVYNGTTWLDTAISHIRVYDTSPGTRAAVASVSASSEAPGDGDGNYFAGNIDDGLEDIMWCEGQKDGDGTGEWLDIKFSGPQQISKLHVFNGIGTSMIYWFKGNRATKATLSFSDGSTEKVEIPNKFKEQVVSFAPRKASSVKITFDEVSKGKEYNDLCISEAYFSQ